MASLNSLYVKKETLETLVKGLEKKGEKGIELTVNIKDEGNDYFQNVAAYVSQSKDEREHQKKRFYVGNGNTFWTDGNMEVVKKPKNEEPQVQTAPNDDEQDDLPF